MGSKRWGNLAGAKVPGNSTRPLGLWRFFEDVRLFFPGKRSGPDILRVSFGRPADQVFTRAGVPWPVRRALLEGMSGDVPEEYEALKQRYFEELVRQ